MRWLVLALVTLQSATCGQKGPLTLPAPDAVQPHFVHRSAGPR
jgi:predicted small lipoprotein YifL